MDMKVHQKTVERLRDTPLADNCSSQDWEKRMTEFNTSNDLTARPLAGQELTKVLLDMMPEDLATDKRRIKADLVAASKMGDPMHASKCIVKEIADAHRPGLPKRFVALARVGKACRRRGARPSTRTLRCCSPPYLACKISSLGRLHARVPE